ncbi:MULTISPECIES: CbiQ family ECF transporter T component [unclassified Luteococcus]|uniref:CbiQ family ECF transporter T component n=1 Tax=unclassified Luteococcus TaxID=2639923 RepID=UPI00313C30BA
MTRTLHPMAWWAWALGCAVAVSTLYNPLLVVLVVAAVWAVVLNRRTRAPWAKAAGAYLTLALVVLGIRVFFQILLGINRTGQVLFTLPQLQLPGWAAGLRIGGPVTLDGLLYTLYDSLRLVAMLLCVGAANALANPKRALRVVPPALHQLSVALVVALSVAPQLIESVQRVRRARRLRGGASRGWHAVRAVVVPVLEDAIERSMLLAAGMEARGYGRTHAQRPVGRALTALLLGALVLITLATFLLLGIPGSGPWGWALLALGLVAAWLGLHRSGQRLAVTRYRPDPWEWPEWSVCAAGALAVGAVLWLQRVVPDVMSPSSSPPVWPQLDPRMLLVPALALLPLLTTPKPPKDAL